MARTRSTMKITIKTPNLKKASKVGKPAKKVKTPKLKKK